MLLPIIPICKAYFHRSGQGKTPHNNVGFRCVIITSTDEVAPKIMLRSAREDLGAVCGRVEEKSENVMLLQVSIGLCEQVDLDADRLIKSFLVVF